MGLGEIWFTEKHNPASGFSLKVDRFIYETRSQFQRIVVFDNADYERVFLLDDLIMLTEKDEFTYHEMLTQPTLFTHKNPKNVLIIGGGDGGTAREILKHKMIKEVDMVEIDKEVIETSKRFLKFCGKAFKDKRLKITIGDGIKYVKETNKKYDLIFVDSTDPIGMAKGLFSKSFYRNCYKILKEDGILTTLSESPFNDPKWTKEIFNNLKEVFKNVFLYLSFVPAYPSGVWSFCMASKIYHPLKNFQEERYKNFKSKTKYYNKEIHFACFCLPEFVKDLINA